jgi:hypothetical protein
MRIQAGTDAGTDGAFRYLAIVRGEQMGKQFAAYAFHCGGARNIPEKHGEFVAAHAGSDIRAAQAAVKPS